MQSNLQIDSLAMIGRFRILWLLISKNIFFLFFMCVFYDNIVFTISSSLQMIFFVLAYSIFFLFSFTVKILNEKKRKFFLFFSH